VISRTGEPFCCFVLNYRPKCGQHRPGALVLRCDKLDRVLQPVILPRQKLIHVRVRLAKGVEDALVIFIAALSHISYFGSTVGWASAHQFGGASPTLLTKEVSDYVIESHIEEQHEHEDQADSNNNPLYSLAYRRAFELLNQKENRQTSI